jgi:hypothetical protein
VKITQQGITRIDDSDVTYRPGSSRRKPGTSENSKRCLNEETGRSQLLQTSRFS